MRFHKEPAKAIISRSRQGRHAWDAYKEATQMATFISLLRWTQKGIENVKDGPARLDAASAPFRAVGAEIKSFHLVMGRYDAVVVSEAPSDEAAAKALLSICSRGNVQTETFRAFSEDEFRKIVSALP